MRTWLCDSFSMNAIKKPHGLAKTFIYETHKRKYLYYPIFLLDSSLRYKFIMTSNFMFF